MKEDGVEGAEGERKQWKENYDKCFIFTISINP